MAQTPSIPTLDLRDLRKGTRRDRARFIEALGEALEHKGFVAITHHQIDLELLQRARDVARKTFALSDEVKRQYAAPENRHERGYTPFNTEHAKDQAVADLKEFWHVGRVLPSIHPMSLSGQISANIFPNEMPSFALTFSSLFDSLEAFALELLDALGSYLEQPRSFFREMVKDGNSVLRVIHYPDVAGDAEPGAVRAAAHEDINLLTVLPAADRPGLELLTREGEWMPVLTPPDVMICDTGDMMALVTGGQIRATRHRVVNPPGGNDGGRISMPFFLHPHPESILAPLRPYQDGPIRAQDFFFQRLNDIGVA